VKLTPAVRLTAAIALVLLLAGGALLWLAATTPWHTDSNAYFSELATLRAHLYMREPNLADFKAATSAFQALQDKYATRKWLYADMAYAGLSLGLFMVVIAGLVARFGARLLRTQRDAVVVLGVTLAALAATLAGLWSDPWHRFYREQLPEWSDTLAIPLAGALVAMIPIATITLLLVAPPLIFRRKAAGPLLVFTRPPHWPSITVNVLYALPLAFAVFLLTSVASRGGWALAPAGLMLLWLFLNGRALWIAPKEEGAA
jgi:MFS family permease